jgi:hypothetical protein
MLFGSWRRGTTRGLALSAKDTRHFYWNEADGAINTAGITVGRLLPPDQNPANIVILIHEKYQPIFP